MTNKNIKIPHKVRPDRYPMPGEICVTSDFKNSKRNALLFDRIYISTLDDSWWTKKIPDELTFGIHKFDEKAYIEAHEQGLLDKKLIHDAIREFGMTSIRNYRSGFTSNVYNKLGISVIPTYADDDSFAIDFLDGNDVAYQAVINNVPVISEVKTTWEQIIEFRSDKETLRKYRDLRIWLKDGLNTDDVQQATDIIGQKLDNYEWALKKHGMETVSGTIAQVFDLKSTVFTGLISATGTVLGGPVWGAIAAGLSYTSRTCLYFIERMISLKDLKRDQNSEVAILHDIKKFK